MTCDSGHGTKVIGVLICVPRNLFLPEKIQALEVVVQYSSLLEPVYRPQATSKPRLTSLDSGQECSLEHWLAVCKLVEREDIELDGYVFDETCLHVSQ